MNGTMKDYQLLGVSFMIWLFDNGMGGILGDEMVLSNISFSFYIFFVLGSRKNFTDTSLSIILES